MARQAGSDSPKSTEQPVASQGRSRWALLALPTGGVAAFALWQGDALLTRHNWLVGGAVFGVGLIATGTTIRLLRRAGLVR